MPMGPRQVALCGILLCPLAAPADGAVPTFSRDIAPIVFKHCAYCHRPGQTAPFSLLSYRDVSRRARQIEDVTRSRFMPPWQPTRDGPAFVNERTLSDAQIQTISQWVAAGTPEGDPVHLPPLPEWKEGWTYGIPDLVLAGQRPYELAAEGIDEFRNLVIHNPLKTARFVHAVEIRPNSPAVHHAIMQLDNTGECRRLDARSDEPGFPGMSMGRSEAPGGHFISWTPGKLPRELPAGMAWRLHPGSDLVLQLHLTRTGKIEAVQPQIGLYFTDQAPSRIACTIVLDTEDIDIPAGATDHVIRAEYVFPVASELFGIYPHAHYLAKQIRGVAHLPDGSQKLLLHIKNWDFFWQDDYPYVRPFVLPKGTRVTMEWTYDNSADNPRNQNNPPKRVRYGLRSDDEMGTLSLHLAPLDVRAKRRLQIEQWRPYALSANHRLPLASNIVAALLLEDRRPVEAVPYLERAIESDPRFVDSYSNLGRALQRLGRLAKAEAMFRKTLEFQPDHDSANAELGMVLAAMGRPGDAAEHYEKVLEAWPHLFVARVMLGNLLLQYGKYREAIKHYHLALEIRPDMREAHNNLANAHFLLGEWHPAIKHYQKVLKQKPDSFNAHFNLGRSFKEIGDIETAMRHIREALRLDPDDELAREVMDDLQRAE